MHTQKHNPDKVWSDILISSCKHKFDENVFERALVANGGNDYKMAKAQGISRHTRRIKVNRCGGKRDQISLLVAFGSCEIGERHNSHSNGNSKHRKENYLRLHIPFEEATEDIQISHFGEIGKEN